MSFLFKRIKRLISKRVDTVKYKDKPLKEKIRLLIQDIISNCICCMIPVLILFLVGVFIFNFLTASVTQVATNFPDEFTPEENKDAKYNACPSDCPCGDCSVLKSDPITYTTGDLSGSRFTNEVLALVNRLAQDTGTYPWLPYAEASVEYAGALAHADRMYVNYSSIYSQSTDLLNGGHASSIGLLQIQTNSLSGYAHYLTANKVAFNNAVVSAGGDLGKYTTIADSAASSVYDDRLYLPSQLGTYFYYFKENRERIINKVIDYIPGYNSLNEDEKEIVDAMCIMAAWNNGENNMMKGFKGSSNKRVGKYLVSFAKLYCTDIGYSQLMAIDKISSCFGNNYTGITKDVLKLLGENPSEYAELDNVGSWTSRIYCYTTNAVLGGSYLYTAELESAGIKVSGTLGNLRNTGTTMVSGNFDDIKLNYTENSVDGEIRQEYKTVYGGMDYKVDLLKIGSGYQTIGSEDDLPDRKLTKIDGIVIHYTGGGINGTASGTRAWFDRPYTGNEKTGTNTSSHYVIGVDGEILQLAPLDNETIASNGANSTTISIEVNYTDANGAYGSKAYNSLLHLVAWLCVEFNIDTGTNFVSADNSNGNTLYRDMGAIQRHYDVPNSIGSTVQRSKACPLYWVPDDGSAQESGTTDGGNARWISFKKDVTSFILNNRYDVMFAPNIKDIPGLDGARKLAKGNVETIWGSGNASGGLGSPKHKCNCPIPCPRCHCHDNEVIKTGFNGAITGRAGTSDIGYGAFKGETWASSQFLDNAKTVMAAMVSSGLGYSQTKFYDPIGGFYPIRYDCSGYVSAVLNYSGYNDIKNWNSRSFDASLDNSYGWTKITDINKLKAGDIMIMTGGIGETGIGHAQIYAGNYKVYNVGDSSYLVSYPGYNPKDARSYWESETAKRFVFAWRPTAPNN